MIQQRLYSGSVCLKQKQGQAPENLLQKISIVRNIAKRKKKEYGRK